MAERRKRPTPREDTAGAGGVQVDDLLRNLGLLGLDSGRLCRDVGLDASTLAGRDTRVPWRLIRRLLTTAEELRNDPLIALHAAELGSRDLLAYLVATQPTVEQAVRELARFLAVALDDLQVAIERRPSGAAIVFEIWSDASGTSRHVREYLAAVIVADLHGASGGRFRPREVGFPHGRAGALAEYERILRCRVRFDQPRFEIVISDEVLQTPLDTQSPEVAAVLHEVAERQLGIAAAAGLRPRVAAALRAALAGGEGTDSSAIAKRLAMSLRTLQRRLEDEGTSFRELRDDTRRERAIQRLGDPSVTIAAIADEMGFRDIGTFHKAFRRWTGTSPRAYRRETTSQH